MKMSAKARDGQGRWRCKTIGVRVSPEENAEIDALAALSGMSKQDYCIHRMLQRDVVVIGNPRVHKALKIQMEQLCREFSKLCSVNDVSAEGLGFTLALACMGAIREFFGTGCLLGFTIIPNFSIGFFNLPPGGFFVFGVLIAIMQAATKGKALKAKGFSCGLCPMYNSCNTAEANEEVEAEKAAKTAAAV